jgi:hypothetical protein
VGEVVAGREDARAGCVLARADAEHEVEKLRVAAGHCFGAG